MSDASHTDPESVKPQASERAPSGVESSARVAQEIEGIEGGAAVTVEFAEEKQRPPDRLVSSDSRQSLAPTTTKAEDDTKQGQRRISMLWESVQGTISISITVAVIYCQLNGISSETLNNAFFFVIATYLQRTNHVRIGGVGPKDNEYSYRGR